MASTQLAPSQSRRSFESDKEKGSLEDVAVNAIASLEEPSLGADSTLPPPPSLSPEQEIALYRKVDLWVMVVCTYSHMLPFSDRTGNGNVALTNFVGNQANISLMIFWIPFCLFVIPGTLALKKFGPSKWIPLITFAWGVIQLLNAFSKTFKEAVAARFFMGLIEAATPMAILFYITLWYPRHKLGYRFGLVHILSTVMSMVSGVVPWLIGLFDGFKGLQSWAWIFIINGLINCIIGTVGFFVVADGPATAKFLTPEERAYVIWQKKYDYSGVGESKCFAWRYILAAFTDWQVWMHVLNFIAYFTPLYGISLFMSTITSGFGLKAGIAAVLIFPPYLISIILFLFVANLSDRVKMRSPFILGGMVVALVGFAINIADVSNGAKYFGVFLCILGLFGGMPSLFAWTASNLAGEYKRGTGMALQVTMGNVAGVIAALVYQKDSPNFVPGHAVSIAFLCLGFITVPATIVLYKRANAEKDRKLTELVGKSQYSAEEVHELGDKALDYKYIL